MDILYIVGKGHSQCDNIELKYSLRSIEKHGKNINRVFVAGYCPEWLSDEIIKVPFTQPYVFNPKSITTIENDVRNLAKKSVNILATILYVADHTDIGEEFLVSMDDHFYIKDVDFNNYPFYIRHFANNDTLPIEGDRWCNSIYRLLCAKTRQILEEQGLPVFYFTCHRNLHLCRRDINECREFLNKVIDEALPVECFVYLNNYRLAKHHDFEPKVILDIKLRHPADEIVYKLINPNITECFSTCDFKENSKIDNFLKGFFAQKSKYEK